MQSAFTSYLIILMDENVNAYETYLNMKEKFLDVLKTKNKRRYLNDSKNKTIDVEQIIINMSDDEELFDFIEKMK